jgi:predicted TIM-barrel fold metal-dependent hydrolase
MNMYQGSTVVDAVVHTYNWLPENYRIPQSADFAKASYRLHCRMSKPAYTLSEEEYLSNWQPEELSGLVFGESDTDFAIFHAVPLDDYFYDGLISLEKGIEFRRLNPGRSALYGSLNPLDPIQALEHLDYLANEVKVDGIKIYPVRYVQGRSLLIALDDVKMFYPILERCLELGIRTVAVHKAIPFGRTAQRCYRVDDIDEAAACFPDLNFEIVHAGMAFLEETAYLLARHPNVWANLEVTSTLISNQPRRFAEVLGQLLYWGGPDRILFATGAHFVHPQPVIEAFGSFEFDEDLISGYGYPQLTKDIKDKILGLNALRLLGIDPASLQPNTHSNDLDAPWSVLRHNASQVST